MSRLDRQPGSDSSLTRRELLLGGGALLALIMACGGEAREAALCPEDPVAEGADSGPELGPPSVEVTGHESNGLDFRVQFNVPKFNPREVPSFETKGCGAFPLKVRARARFVRNPSNPSGGGVNKAQMIVGEKLIFQPGADSVEFQLPDKFCTVTSYDLTLFDCTEGGGAGVGQCADSDLLFESPAVKVDDYGPARLDE